MMRCKRDTNRFSATMHNGAERELKRWPPAPIYCICIFTYWLHGVDYMCVRIDVCGEFWETSEGSQRHGRQLASVGGAKTERAPNTIMRYEIYFVPGSSTTDLLL